MLIIRFEYSSKQGVLLGGGTEYINTNAEKNDLKTKQKLEERIIQLVDDLKIRDIHNIRYDIETLLRYPVITIDNNTERTDTPPQEQEDITNIALPIFIQEIHQYLEIRKTVRYYKLREYWKQQETIRDYYNKNGIPMRLIK